jgi:hypothetical protein
LFRHGSGISGTDPARSRIGLLWLSFELTLEWAGECEVGGGGIFRMTSRPSGQDSAVGINLGHYRIAERTFSVGRKAEGKLWSSFGQEE